MKSIIKTDFKDTKSAFYSLVDLCKQYGLDVETDSASTTASYYINASLGNYDKSVEIRISDHTKMMDQWEMMHYSSIPAYRIINSELVSNYFVAEVLTQEDLKNVYAALELFLIK